jgi:hypothetical protein
LSGAFAPAQIATFEQQGHTMIATPYTSLYDHRVEMVRNVIEQNSKLGTKRSADLAVLVLHAIDHIPEAVR